MHFASVRNLRCVLVTAEYVGYRSVTVASHEGPWVDSLSFSCFRHNLNGKALNGLMDELPHGLETTSMQHALWE